MLNPMNDTVSKHFSNGLSIKGSFKHSVRGCYIDVYLMDNRGLILASKSFAMTGSLVEPQALLKTAIAKVEAVVKQYRVDYIVEEDELEKTCPKVMAKAFPKIA